MFDTCPVTRTTVYIKSGLVITSRDWHSRACTVHVCVGERCAYSHYRIVCRDVCMCVW